MKKKYEIVLEFVKDISSETKDTETYIYVKENSKFTFEKVTPDQKESYDAHESTKTVAWHFIAGFSHGTVFL